MEAHCTKRGRTRLLHADRPIVTVSQQLVRDADGRNDGGRAARVLVSISLYLPMSPYISPRGARAGAPASAPDATEGP